MQRLADVLCLRKGRKAPDEERSRAWLEAALFGDVDVRFLAEAVGQFEPGAAGGPNSSPFGAAPSLVNPWSWVLLVEGALVFASAAARRLGAGARGKAAIPFTVESSPVGYTSGSSTEHSRGEVWAPLWARPATSAEVSYLVGEGRSEWRGRTARSGLDMARATASLGVDRGIGVFVRHALLERNGLATVAVPVGRVRAAFRAEVPVVAQLDFWLDRVRSTADKPAAVAGALRVTDAALFDLALRGGGERLLHVLAAVAELEMAVGRATQFRERARAGPVQALSAAEWLPHLDMVAPEVRLAAALASMRDPDGSCLRSLLRPAARSRGRWAWTASPPAVSGYGALGAVDVLAAAHVRRVIEVARRPERDDGDDAVGGDVGVQTAFVYRLTVPPADVVGFLVGRVDDALLDRALAAMLLLDWDDPVDLPRWPHADPMTTPPLPAWWLLAPFFCGRTVVHRQARVRLRPEATWPALLAAGSVQSVLAAAARRLRIARLDPVVGTAGSATLARCAPPGPRLAAGLLCPIGPRAAEAALDLTCPKHL